MMSVSRPKLGKVPAFLLLILANSEHVLGSGVQYSRFFCGNPHTDYIDTNTDLPLLEQGLRLASIYLEGSSRLYRAQSTYASAKWQWSSTRPGAIHGGGTREGVSTTLDMTPYWDPQDPSDRIVAVSTCCTMYDNEPLTIVLRTAGGALVGNDWCNPEALDWEPVPPGYIVGGLVSKSRPRGVRGPEARVYQLAFIFVPPDYGPSYLKPPPPGSPLPPAVFATASSFNTPSDGGRWGFGGRGSTPFPIWGIIAPAIPVAIFMVLAVTAFIRRRSRRAVMMRQQQLQAVQQGQGTGQHQGTGGGSGGAEEGVGSGAAAAGAEAVVVDAAFEALVAKLPAECEVPPVFLCPITQDIMRCPVVAADGYTYEQAAVRQWMAGAHGGPARSPLTNLPFEHGGLVPNLALRGQIRAWLEGRAGEGEKKDYKGGRKQVDEQSDQRMVELYVVEGGRDSVAGYGGPTAEDKA